MPVALNQVGKVVFTGIFKVLNQASPRWDLLREQEIEVIFAGIANPTRWPNFFLEAVGTAIQNELIVRGSYFDDLDRILKEHKDTGKTWANLEDAIMRGMRVVNIVY